MGVESAFGYIFAFIALAYTGLITAYTFGWFSLKNYKAKNHQQHSFISIIIPVRNEEKNIQYCLKDLLAQEYPLTNYEIIVVDDHSMDKTADIVQRIISAQKGSRLKLIQADANNGHGKKYALRKGIQAAKGRIIATTDADCRIENRWLTNINSFYIEYKPKMISAPVVMYKEDSWFKQLQSLEFLSLIASGAGSVAINAPVMCNAANLIFEKAAFEEVDALRKDHNYASGDDIFLMLQMRKKYGKNAVRFLKSRQAQVFTLPEPSLNSFLSQRMRWISKAKGYTALQIIFSSLVVYLFNYAIFVAFILSFWFPDLFIKALFLLGIKIIVDLPVIGSITSFARKSYLMWHYLLLQVLYILYVSLLVPVAFLFKYNWKGRKSRR